MEIRKDRDADYQRAERNDPGIAFAAVHSHVNDAKTKHDDEKLSIFWRVFGGTILSICALISVTIYNNMAGSLSELRGEISRINEARGELIKKDEFNTRISTTYERVQNLQSQNNSQNASITSLQTAIGELKDRLTALKTDADNARKESLAANETFKKDQNTNLDRVKKDQALINDGFKKDIAVIEGLKERITATEALKKELDGIKKELAGLEVIKEKMTVVLAEMKDHRDEIAKLRHESERNLAADTERKKNRDDQYAKLLDAIKELDRAVRASSEKIARLEGSVTPAAPLKPAKPNSPSNTNPSSEE